MTIQFVSKVLVAALAVSTACNVEHDRDVVEVSANGLGVASLVTERATDGTNTVFELRALSATNKELGSVRVTVGEIPDLSRWTGGGDNVGAEVVLAFGGMQERKLTRDTGEIVLPAVPSEHAEIVELLQIDAVRALLRHEANVVVAEAASASGDETPYYYPYLWVTGSCASGNLLSSPLAAQCCQSKYHSSYYLETHFVNPSNAVIVRTRHYKGGYCVDGNGAKGCTGRNCVYGPNGFSTPQSTPPSTSYPYGFVTTWELSEAEGPQCESHHVASPPTAEFPTVSGSAGTACGCSCNGAGTRCLDTDSDAYKNRGGTCAEANGVTCNSTGCPVGGGGGADKWAY